MFSLFKKRKQLKVRDLVWMTLEDKYTHLLRRLDEEVKAGAGCVILTYFEQCHGEVKAGLEAAGLAYADGAGPDNTRSILLCHAECLIEKPDLLGRLDASRLTFFFPEHFPARDYEQELLECLYLQRPEAEAIFYSSLDEPFLQCFNNERFGGLIESLHSDSSEAIEHPILSMSIVNAQKKIQSRVNEPQAAESQLGWLERNLRD